MKTYHTYLFDADGTLFDTADCICTCFQYVAEKHSGRTLDLEKVIAGIGLPLREMIFDNLGEDLDIEAVLADYLEYQLQILEETITPFPGVLSTLESLKQAGKQLAVVTSRRRLSLGKILQATGTDGFFDILVTPEDTKKHKPNAEPPLKAISLLGADKASTVFTGDAQYDICSGASAGIDTIFVNWSRASLSSLPVTPTWTIDLMQELTIGLNHVSPNNN